MTYLAKPRLHHPTLPSNKLGFTRRDYEGKISTLCAGCGHDSISAALIQACWELDIEPHRVAKLSGIGCSSKTPDYFLGDSHGFNTVHGRMPSVLTGANLANRELLYLGVSGDGDSASIGLGQFAHAMRRGVNMTYIVENNGVYGLTKGQFSATADQGSKSKKGAINSDTAIDLVAMALQLGASYVGRSFSGDKEQLVPLIKGAISHRGAALIDVISPCVAFNNHPGSTKSYDYVRAHNEAVNRLDFMPRRDAITAAYAPGEVIEVTQHDGSVLRLRKLAEGYDPGDRLAAMSHIAQHEARGEILTGLLYVNAAADDLHGHLKTVDRAAEPARPPGTLPRRRRARGDQRRTGLARRATALRRRPRRTAAADEGATMSELVRYAVVDGVATLAMDDGKANVMSEAMLQALDAGFDRAQADGATVLLTGRPGMFSGGFDLAVFKTDPAALFRMLEAGARLTEKVLSFPYPVVAACSGHAIAMGAFLLLSTDLRIGVDQGARIQINEVKIGLTLPRFAIEVCRQRLSPAHFSRAVLTAEPYSGPAGGGRRVPRRSLSFGVARLDRGGAREGALDAAPRVVPRDQVAPARRDARRPPRRDRRRCGRVAQAAFARPRLSRFKVVGVGAWNAARALRRRADGASRSFDVTVRTARSRPRAKAPIRRAADRPKLR